MTARLILALVVLSGCRTAPPRPTADVADSMDALLELGALEQQRSLGAGKVVSLATTSRDEQVRARAYRVLGRLQDPRTIDVVISGLRDTSAAVRREAAFAVWSYGLSWGVPDVEARSKLAAALLKAEEQESEPAVRDRMLRALGRLSLTNANARLVARLRDENPRIQTAAAISLGVALKREEPLQKGGLPVLVALLSNTDDNVRFGAAYALSFLKVANHAASASMLIAAQRLALDDTDAEIRLLGARGLAGQGCVEQGRLGEALEDSDWRVAVEATRALARCADAKALEGLSRLEKALRAETEGLRDSGGRDGAQSATRTNQDEPLDTGGAGGDRTSTGARALGMSPRLSQPLLALAQLPPNAALQPLVARLRSALRFTTVDKANRGEATRAEAPVAADNARRGELKREERSATAEDERRGEAARDERSVAADHEGRDRATSLARPPVSDPTRRDMATLDCRLAAAEVTLRGEVGEAASCGGDDVDPNWREALLLNALAAVKATRDSATAMAIVRKARPLISHGSPPVRRAALEALTAHAGQADRTTLFVELARHEELALAASAMQAFAPAIPEDRRLALAEEVRRRLTELEVAPDVAEPLFDALVVLAGPDATADLTARLDAPHAHVRNVAAVQLSKLTGRDVAASSPPTASPPVKMPVPLAEGTRLRVRTEKGDFIVRLFLDDAPVTAATIARLARDGFYERLTFHRVVPDFVVQGGAPRDDGEGGPGFTQRCEVSPRPYFAGTVGMALSGKDTGGSQFFVTHSPHPHLEGRYPVFGQLESGQDVVDRLLEGDALVGIDVLPPGQ